MSTNQAFDTSLLDEALNTVGRLTNLAGAAEGSNLPPRVERGQRVPVAKGFRVLANTPFSGGVKVTLSWDTPENKTGINHYRIYTFNTNNSATNPASTTASETAPVTFDVLALIDHVLVFRIQTVLNNGLMLPVSECPSCSLTVSYPTWTSATLLNSWVNYGSGYYDAAYFKDTHGLVHLRGTIKNGTATNGTTLFTLPTGYYPSANSNQIARHSGSVPATILTDTSGNVKVYDLASNSDLSLDGIYFSIY